MDEIQFERKNNYIINFINIIQKFYDTLNPFENEFEINEIKKVYNIFCLEDAFNFINEISYFCINKIYEEKFIKYMNFFYPENLAILIFHYFNNIINNEEKILFLNKSLIIIVNILHQDYILNHINFDQKKYYKLLFHLIYLITNSNSNLNKHNQKIDYLSTIYDALKLLSPMNYPGFILAWIDLISYKKFIENFLDINLIKENSDKYEKYLSLIIDLLAYINLLKNKIINSYHFKIILDEIYKFFFIIWNTYPEFISSYSFILLSHLSLSSSPDDEDCNAFLQLKNIILSAEPPKFSSKENKEKKFDKNFNEDNFLNLDLCKINNNGYISNKKEFQLNELLNNYINDINNAENSLELILNCLDNIKEEKELYKVYNEIIIYWPLQKQIEQNKIKKNNIFYEFYYFLLCNLNEIHKKYLIDSILNALRFPCSQTINYSELFQELFINIENEDIEEQLMVNLLERVLYKPIPWGIKFTLNCLFNNEKYRQMEKKYISQNSEIIDFINRISINLTENDFNFENNV